MIRGYNKNITIVLLSLFLLNFVLAGVSSSGVEYDDEIKKILTNEGKAKVIVEIKDLSNITINYEEDSAENQKAKDNQRIEVYKETMEKILSKLSEDDFELEGSSEFGSFFYGNITQHGLEKLLNNEMIEKIHDNTKIGTLNLAQSALQINANDVWAQYNGTGQTICVIDTGVDYNRPDLGGCFGRLYGTLWLCI